MSVNDVCSEDTVRSVKEKLQQKQGKWFAREDAAAQDTGSLSVISFVSQP